MPLQDHVKSSNTEGLSNMAQKESVVVLGAEQDRPAVVNVGFERIDRKIAEEDDSLFGSLSTHEDRSSAPVDLVQRKPEQLAHAQPGGVHDLEHAAVPAAQRRGSIRRGQ